METIAGIIRYLPKYFIKILEAWIVWVWFPALDALGLVVETFMPTFSPPREIYWLIPGVGFVVANVKLLLDYENKLKAYEYQAPEYEFQIINVRTEVCRMACHIIVCCDVSIKATTPWTGYIIKVTVDGENPIQGLGIWKVRGVSGGDHCASVAHWPLEIPDSGLNLQIRIQAETSGQIDPSKRDRWKRVTVPVNFVIGYITQPVGKVQKLKKLIVQSDLEKDIQSVLEYQDKIARQ